jgi:EmrB/QacA subfamily drug resistance transporter
VAETTAEWEATRPPVSRAETRSGPALVALAGAALVAVLDGTVVAVALGPLSDALHAPLTTVVWVMIGYLLAAAATLPLLGWATARFGGRAVFLAGLGLFAFGSLLCALSRTPGELIGARVVQGAGGGLLEPSAMALATGLGSVRTMGRVLGVMATVINVAPVGGPLVGTLLLRTGHWQWLFLVNLPLAALVLAGTLVFVPATRPPAGAARPAADVRGLGLLVVGYVGVLFAVNRAGEDGAGGWVPVAVAAGVGLILLAGYVRHAVTTRRPPALDLRLLRRPAVASSIAVMSLVGLLMYSLTTALPVFVASHHDRHGLAQGLLVSALGLGLLVSMSTGGRLSDRVGARPLVRVGAAGTTAGLAVFAATADRLSLGAGFALFVAVGLCFGLTGSSTVAGLFRALAPDERPQGTTALFLAIQFAGSLGVAVLALVRDRTGDDWPRVEFALLAGAAAVLVLLATRLPTHLHAGQEEVLGAAEPG